MPSPKSALSRLGSGKPLSDQLSPSDFNVLWKCYTKGCRAALARDKFNPYRDEEHVAAGGYEPNAAAWDRGHAYTTGQMNKVNGHEPSHPRLEAPDDEVSDG